VRSRLDATSSQLSCHQVFGAFATLLLLQTGTLAAPVAAHCFCNYCGVPDFPRMLRHGPAVRLTLYVGVLTFFVALNRFCKIP
jgi:prenyl protein peptidase